MFLTKDVLLFQSNSKQTSPSFEHAASASILHALMFLILPKWVKINCRKFSSSCFKKSRLFWQVTILPYREKICYALLPCVEIGNYEQPNIKRSELNFIFMLQKHKNQQ